MASAIFEHTGVSILIGMVSLYYAYRVMVLKDVRAVVGKNKPEPKDKEGFCRDTGKLIIFFAIGSFLMAGLELFNARNYKMSMYSVLMVDDEEDVVRAMQKKIDWESIGFRIMGYAHNGIEALDLAEQEAPDVVLTDIKMPYMDGLELAHNLKIMYPAVRILIFSGFDEFEYAKEAIRLEVEEYILKPVDADELRRIFTKIKESLDREMDEKRNVQKLRDYYMESLPLLQENFYSSLVEGNVSEADLTRFLSDYQIEMKSPMYAAVVIHTSTTQLPEGISAVLLTESVRRLAQEHLANKWDARLFPHEGNIVLLAPCRSQEDVMRITDEAEAFCRLAKHVSQAVVTIGIGKICRNLSEIPESYRGAREAVSYRSLYGAGKQFAEEASGPVQGSEDEHSGDRKKGSGRLCAGDGRRGRVPEHAQIHGDGADQFPLSFCCQQQDRYGTDLRGGRAAVPQCSQHGFHTAGGLALQGIPHDAGAAAEQQG